MFAGARLKLLTVRGGVQGGYTGWVSQAAGSRMFREGGGMPTIRFDEPSGRYLSFEEREEIALLRAKDVGIPASSGKTTRHRLNRGGNRPASHALWTIAMVRLRYDERTHAYRDRRTTEGKTPREILRGLKRYSPARSTEPSSPSWRPTAPPHSRSSQAA